jgi:large subunit ribosomal protein L3
MPLGLIGKKLGHTSVYDVNGMVTPVTVVLAGPNRVLQIKTAATDGYNAVQLGFGDQKPQRLSKAVLGHLAKFGALDADEVNRIKPRWEKGPQAKSEKKAKPTKGFAPIAGIARIREFRDFSKEVKRGELLSVNLFAPGDFVDCIGITKGRGFEGVVKRHRFRGGDSTHGAKGWHRRSGAIGQRLFPGTVMRGMKMPGHMGHVRRTTQNLEIIQVREADHLLLIRGSIPGSEGDYVIIREAKKLPKGSERAKTRSTRLIESAEKKEKPAKGAAPAKK